MILLRNLPFSISRIDLKGLLKKNIHYLINIILNIFYQILFNVNYMIMKKLDKYILKQFINKFFLSMIAFIVIFILVDIIDRLDKFIDARMTRKEIIQYYYLTIPWFISIATPMSLLLSTVFTMGILQKRNEITALKASGISIRRLSISSTNISGEIPSEICKIFSTVL